MTTPHTDKPVNLEPKPAKPGLHSSKTDRQTDRQTDKQTDRQTDRQTGRQTDRQTVSRAEGGLSGVLCNTCVFELCACESAHFLWCSPHASVVRCIPVGPAVDDVVTLRLEMQQRHAAPVGGQCLVSFFVSLIFHVSGSRSASVRAAGCRARQQPVRPICFASLILFFLQETIARPKNLWQRGVVPASSQYALFIFVHSHSVFERLLCLFFAGNDRKAEEPAAAGCRARQQPVRPFCFCAFA